ncbi:hypothetical protein EVA_15082 [gut metagenome]|uniref:Uncharacterized protein n=1 Tax=gut metagenome TaxID=749906 RepID=J9G4S0_9ZZZZ
MPPSRNATSSYFTPYSASVPQPLPASPIPITPSSVS